MFFFSRSGSTSKYKNRKESENLFSSVLSTDEETRELLSDSSLSILLQMTDPDWYV